MYQVSLSVGENNAKWFEDIKDVLYIRLKKYNGILATHAADKRLNISLACENDQKSNVVTVLRECLADMYGTVVKYDYLRNKLKMPLLDANSYQMLLHTLVAFDRENEREIILSKLAPGVSPIALDGVFHFLLNELKGRWDEIAALAADNALYLNNEETLNELLRFLISAVNPKIMKLELRQRENGFFVSGELADSSFEFNITSTEQLMIYLIDIAPLELNLHGSFSDKRLYQRLVSIFDAKSDNTLSDRLQS